MYIYRIEIFSLIHLFFIILITFVSFSLFHRFSLEFWTACKNHLSKISEEQKISYPLTLISVSLTVFRYFTYQVATQLSSRGQVNPFPDPVLLEKFLGYSRESNPSNTYKTIILQVLLYGCETWSLLLREKQRTRAFENKVPVHIWG